MLAGLYLVCRREISMLYVNGRKVYLLPDTGRVGVLVVPGVIVLIIACVGDVQYRCKAYWHQRDLLVRLLDYDIPWSEL